MNPSKLVQNTPEAVNWKSDYSMFVQPGVETLILLPIFSIKEDHAI